ncbi:hypothetical protein A9Q81_21910 [Gammaproteobacteria bacterium 42_54_T18]|nr:hypothetical protein A9Q81_21910 [Gammaproteobacteria bacterium 42_54_T18]
MVDYHGYGGGHAQYNKHASNLFSQYCKQNNINPSKMTVVQAKDFYNNFFKNNPHIREFNMATRGPYPAKYRMTNSPVFIRGVGAMMFIDIFIQSYKMYKVDQGCSPPWCA